MTPPFPPDRLSGLAAASLTCLLVSTAACTTPGLDESKPADESNDRPTAQQPLGESHLPYTYGGEDVETFPSYHERLALHLLNRYRMDPAAYEIYRPMTMEPYDPKPPLIYSAGASEAGHWQGRHALESGCFCPTSRMKQPAAFNTCCEMRRSGNRVFCASNIVACDAERATGEERRWELLNTGGATIDREFYFKRQLPPDRAPEALPGDLIADALHQSGNFVASPGFNAFGLAQTTTAVTPEDCRPPQDPCERGTCTNPATGRNTCDTEKNPECSGICKGPACEGRCTTDEGRPVSCELPEPPDSEECTPESYPVGFHVSVLQASTNRPRPTLYGGIHMKLGYTQVGDGPVERFGTTPADKLDFATYYYHRRGEAERATAVIDGTCHPMSIEKEGPAGASDDGSGSRLDGGPTDSAPTDGRSSDGPSEAEGRTDAEDGASGSGRDADGGMADADGADPAYIGLRYGARIDASPGCHRYFFSFVDADGFAHRYPEYGTLGAKVVESQNEQGETVHLVAGNDESCPFWSKSDVDQSCLPAGDTCARGQTRDCYTGKANTRGAGICRAGTESCTDGRWSGRCEGETRPEPSETCDNDRDDNCNGTVDEGCDDPLPPDAGADTGTDAAGDAGRPSSPDVSPDGAARPSGDDGGGGGCSTARRPPMPPVALAALTLVGLFRPRPRDRCA